MSTNYPYDYEFADSGIQRRVKFYPSVHAKETFTLFRLGEKRFDLSDEGQVLAIFNQLNDRIEALESRE